MTTSTEFTQLLAQEKCPDVPPVLQALWYAKKGDWHKAHQIVQDASDHDSAWVHAYLHRTEGDISNACYWYRRAGRSQFYGDLDAEWQQITQDLLARIPLNAIQF